MQYLDNLIWHSKTWSFDVKFLYVSKNRFRDVPKHHLTYKSEHVAEKWVLDGVVIVVDGVHQVQDHITNPLLLGRECITHHCNSSDKQEQNGSPVQNTTLKILEEKSAWWCLCVHAFFILSSTSLLLKWGAWLCLCVHAFTWKENNLKIYLSQVIIWFRTLWPLSFLPTKKCVLLIVISTHYN